MCVIISNRLDPYRNLAVEACLLDRADRYAPALLLWRSGPAVVIGKNQNPWRECHLEAVRRDGIHLARRVSGGGAVYHDEGNLNFAIILKRTAYDEERQFGVIRRALKNLGFETRIENRNSLMAGDRKISGNAFCFRKQAAMHHGTILIESDLKRLAEYLAPGPHDIATHAIASIRSNVVNLRDLIPTRTPAEVREALRDAFIREYGGASDPVRAEDVLDPSEIASLRRRYRSDEWVYGYTPGFDLALAHAFPWGALRLNLRVEQGRIREAAVKGLPENETDSFSNVMAGCLLRADELGRAVGAWRGPHGPEIRKWIETMPL